MTFSLLVGFGYFNISFDDFALTQPAPPYRYLTAESHDVSAPIAVQGFVMLHGTIPLSTVTVSYIPEDPPPDDFDLFNWNIPTDNKWLPTASATLITTQSGLEGHLSEGGLAQATCGPGASFSGHSTTPVLNRSSFSTLSCLVTILLLTPVPPHELGPFITQAGIGARKISGQINHVCGLVRNDGVPTIHGGTQSAADAAGNLTNNPFLGGNLDCQNVFTSAKGLRVGIGSLGTDFGNRLTAGVNPDGTDIDVGYPMGYVWNGYDFRAGVNRFFTITSGSMFEHYTVDIPQNKTDGIWQFKEHSKYDSGLMTDCNLNRVGDVLRLDSGSLDSHQGQCIMFKVFNKTDVGTPDVSADVVATGTGSSEMRVFVDVKDGIYDMETAYTTTLSAIPMVPDANNQWTENQLEDDLGTGTNHRFGIVEVDSPFTGVIEVSPDYVLGSEDFFTVVVGIQDNSTDGSVTLDVNSISVGTNDYDFVKPFVSFYEHTITTTTSNELLPELDVGFIDGNYTVGAGVTAPVLPTPPELVENVNATTIASIFLDWDHDAINTTGYRIYRTSTEGTDILPIYDTTTTEDSDAPFGDSGSTVNAVTQQALPIALSDQIIAEFDILLKNDTATSLSPGGIIGGAIYSDATSGSTSNATLAISNTLVATEDLPSGFAPHSFKFRDTSLVNLTAPIDPTKVGVGVFGENSFTGDVDAAKCTTGCVGEGALSAFISGTWTVAPPDDLVLKIFGINQSKLFFDPYINDTGSLDTNFTDTGTLAGSGHTYFYRIVPLNGLIEGDSIEIVNATEPTLPIQVTGLTGFFNQTSQQIQLSWDDVGANSYRLFRTSTDTPDEVIEFNFNTAINPQACGITGHGGPPSKDFCASTDWSDTRYRDEIISRVDINSIRAFGSAAGGDVHVSLYEDANNSVIAGDDTIIANSTNSYDPSTIPDPGVFNGVLRTFYFRDADLVNLTTTVMPSTNSFGIGASWFGRTAGTVVTHQGDGTAVTATRSWSPSTWLGLAHDTRMQVASVNQTKLSDTFVSPIFNTAYNDTTVNTAPLVAGNTYFYRITGLNILGGQGPFSDIINVTAFNSTGTDFFETIDDDVNVTDSVVPTLNPNSIPLPPTGLDATADGVNISLDWDDQGTADEFNVFRNGTQIANVTLSQYIDPSVTNGTVFEYHLQAVNVNGTSGNSTASVVLSNNIPSAVTGAGAMPINGVAVLVEWDDPVAFRGEGSPTTGVNVEYLVFRDDTGDGDPFEFVATVPEGTDFLNDTTVLGGHSYTYKILSSNEVGNATANSTATTPVMVDNALVIRAMENDLSASLEDNAEITIFNSTFNSGPLQTNAQGRAFLFNATGAYNFTVLYTGQNIDFLVNKTLTGVSGVILTEDTVVEVPTNVFRVDCPSNGPNRDFKIFVNSTSDDHFIGNFTTPVCDVDDKVNWQVLYEGLGSTGSGGISGNVTFNTTSLMAYYHLDDVQDSPDDCTNELFTELGVAANCDTVSPTVQNVTGLSGNAINFTIGTSRIVMDTNSTFGGFCPNDSCIWDFNIGDNVGTVTYNWWAKMTDTDGIFTFMDTQLPSVNDEDGIRFEFDHSLGNNTITYEFQRGGTVALSRTSTQGFFVFDNDFHMYTVVHERGSGADRNVSFFRDGVLHSQHSSVFLSCPDRGINTANFCFNDTPPDYNPAPNTLIDELSFWNRNVTSTELLTLYNNGSGMLLANNTGIGLGNGTGGGNGTSDFTTLMKTEVLSLGDFGNNAKNFVVNGTMLNTTYSAPVITSEPIVVSTNSSNVLLIFEELFLQEQPPVTPPPGPPPPPPTQSAGGGGVPRLDITTQLQFFEDLFGFSLFSKIHQMQVGQTQDGTIDITWNSPSPITIESIQVGDQFITWIGFPATPFTVEGNDRISTGKIPYRIMPPNNLCDEVTGQTANCVDRILYEIPVKIFASVEGQPIEASTVIKVNLSLDITLALFTVFIAFVAGVGAIVYRAAVVHPRQRRRAKKELKTKSKDRKQIESRFSAKKSKLRRKP